MVILTSLQSGVRLQIGVTVAAISMVTSLERIVVAKLVIKQIV
jgi:hypothetical protein